MFCFTSTVTKSGCRWSRVCSGILMANVRASSTVVCFSSVPYVSSVLQIDELASLILGHLQALSHRARAACVCRAWVASFAPRPALVYTAMLAEQAGRHDEMLDIMRRVVGMVADGGVSLSIEERNLFSVAIGKVVGSKRSAARIICREKDRVSGHEAAVAQKYFARIKAETDAICADWLGMVETLLASSKREAEQLSSVTEAVFYLKLRAKACRCLAEFSDGVERTEYEERAMHAYKEADERAESGLPATHPIRLDCGLSRARFLYAVDRRAERAVELLRRTYDDAMPELDSLDEDSYKDASLTLQFTRRPGRR